MLICVPDLPGRVWRDREFPMTKTVFLKEHDLMSVRERL